MLDQSLGLSQAGGTALAVNLSLGSCPALPSQEMLYPEQWPFPQRQGLARDVWIPPFQAEISLFFRIC